MADAPDRYCGNCGHELSPEDKFCRNCGTQAHVAARVPTPEADVPVPPPPQEASEGASAPEATVLQKWKPLIWGLVGVIILAALISAVQGGGGSPSQSSRSGNQQQGQHKQAEVQPAAQQGQEKQDEAQQEQKQQVQKPQTKKPQAEKPQAEKPKPAPKPQYASVGEKVPVDDEAYQVNNAWKQNGIHSFMENRKGTFIVVDFTFYNMGSDTRTLDDTALTLKDAQGRSYDVFQDNSMVVPTSKDIFLEDVSPGVYKQGRAIFSVGPTANGFVLECSHTNWLSSAEPAKIKLGF